MMPIFFSPKNAGLTRKVILDDCEFLVFFVDGKLLRQH